MKKRLLVALFLLNLFFVSLAFADTTVSPISGGYDVEKILTIAGTNGGDTIGTLECVRVSSGTYYIVRRDINGNEVYRSTNLDGLFGDFAPVYDSAGALSSYRVLGCVAKGVGSSQIVSYNLNLAMTTISSVKKWPTITTAMYYPGQLLTFSDKSYMTVASNSAGVYMSRFNADGTPYAGWTDGSGKAILKTLDVSSLPEWTDPSSGAVKAALMDNGNIIIGVTGRGNDSDNYSLVLANVNGQGVNNVAPVKYELKGYAEELGGIGVWQDQIVILASYYGGDTDAAMYYLKMNAQLQVLATQEYLDSVPMVPRDISIDPDGNIYFCGGAGTFGSNNGLGDSLWGWIDADDPGSYEINIDGIQANPGENYNSSLGTIAWTPTGAIMGGICGTGQAVRVVYTPVFDTDNTGNDNDPDAPVPEPTTMVLFGIGLVGLAGLARKKAKK